MPLIPEAFQVNDLVELHDGRLAVLIRRETEGFKAKIVERWLDPLAPKPIATSEIEITPTHIKHLLEDERVSWVSPAYLHLTANGPYESEYGVAANLQRESGPISMCIIFENAVSEVTSGVYVVANDKVVVSSRVKTQRPARAVLDYVLNNYSQYDNPGLPTFGESSDDSDNDLQAIDFVMRALSQLEIKSNEFAGVGSNSFGKPWWTLTLDNVFVATAVMHIGKNRFMKICEDRWKTETNWEPSRVLPTGVSKRIASVYKKVQEFVFNSIPDCLAWLGDDRWSQDEGWQEARQALPPQYRANYPRWDTTSAMSLAADIAIGFEDYLLDESVDFEKGGDEKTEQEILVWSAPYSEPSCVGSGMELPPGVRRHLVSFLKSEFGPGILEISEATNFRWSGDGYQALASLRVSKPGLLILEGAAGTGKTITMVHRAVDAAGRVEKVLVVAPNHVFKRRIKYLLRRIDYRGQRSRRNNIEVTTPNLLGGKIRDTASADAFNRNTLQWGNGRHRRQWDTAVNWYKRNSDDGTQTTMNDAAYIPRSIAIEELNLHSKIRKGDADLAFDRGDIPTYGAIFVDEAQDLKGWDWMKLASYSIAFVERNPSVAPELVALVDRRQDIFGVIPNFDVTGPDEDTEGLERRIVRDPNGILRTPLFDVTKSSAKDQSIMKYKKAPQKTLRKFSIGFQEIHSLQKLFQACVDDGSWPIEMKSLTTVLRQSQHLARQAAHIAFAVEQQHGLDNSSLNEAPLPDLEGASALNHLKTNNADELRQALLSEITLADKIASLSPMAIAVRSKVEALTLILITAQATTRVQSNFLSQSWVSPMVRDRRDQPLMAPNVKNYPLAKRVLGPGVLTLVAPDTPPGRHRALHRIGRDCENFGSLKLSTGSRKISIGTIAGLKGLEFGSLVGVLTELERMSFQQLYVLHSRPRFRLTLLDVSGDVLANTVEGVVARLIAGCLPPWGGIVFCRLDELSQHIRDNWEDLRGELEQDRAQLRALWHEKAGPYGEDDACYVSLGPQRPKPRNLGT